MKRIKEKPFGQPTENPREYPREIIFLGILCPNDYWQQFSSKKKY